VTRALQYVPGVDQAHVRLDEAEAIVNGDAAPEALLAAIKEEGYSAQL